MQRVSSQKGAFCLSDPALKDVAVAYKDVPLPSVAEVDSILGDIPSLTEHVAVAAVDATSLVDLSLRFACLAYRRNCQNARNVLVLREPSEDGGVGAAYGVELQFRGERFHARPEPASRSARPSY